MAIFGDTYRDFIGNVGAIGQAAMAKKMYPPGPKKMIQDLLLDIVAELQKDDTVLAIENASMQLRPDIQTYLLRELQFFNAVYPSSSIGGTAQEVDDSETCKESLEEILGAWLPDWLKQLLKILDEILSLVRP
jgi:hypothetical protein